MLHTGTHTDAYSRSPEPTEREFPTGPASPPFSGQTSPCSQRRSFPSGTEVEIRLRSALVPSGSRIALLQHHQRGDNVISKALAPVSKFGPIQAQAVALRQVRQAWLSPFTEPGAQRAQPSGSSSHSKSGGSESRTRRHGTNLLPFKLFGPQATARTHLTL